MNEYLDDFIVYMNVERNYSQYTEENYVYDIEEFQKYLEKNKINYKKLTYEDISKYVKIMKQNRMGATTVNRHLSSLRSFYNYLLKENVVNSNPFNLVKSQKKPIRLPNYMKYNEFVTMVEACDNSHLGIRNRAILESLLATGARVGEVINIKISDVDLLNKEIKVLGKGNKERICYFGNHCLESIDNYLKNSRPFLVNDKECNYLFVNHLGNQLTTRGIRDILDKIILKCGIDTHVSPHTFRHTFATMLLNEGCELKSVQELLGHANLSTTSIYTHLTNDTIKEVYFHTHPRNRE